MSVKSSPENLGRISPMLDFFSPKRKRKNSADTKSRIDSISLNRTVDNDITEVESLHTSHGDSANKTILNSAVKKYHFDGKCTRSKNFYIDIYFLKFIFIDQLCSYFYFQILPLKPIRRTLVLKVTFVE